MIDMTFKVVIVKINKLVIYDNLWFNWHWCDS